LTFTIDIHKTKEVTELTTQVSEGIDVSIPTFSDAKLNSLTEDFRSKIPPIGFMKLRNVYVFGNGCILSQNRERIRSPFLPYTNLNSESGLKLSTAALRPLSDTQWRTRPLRVQELGGTTSLLTQPGDGIFGHWLVDLVPMYALIKTSGIETRPIIKSSVLSAASIPDINGVFDLIGLDKENAIGLTENLDAFFCKELIVPSVVRYGQQIHPFVNELYSQYRIAPLDTVSPKKLYFSRRYWKPAETHRVLRNAEQIEQFYVNKGFTIVYPEKLSFSEKLDLISNATEVVGEKGTALHLSLFSNSLKKMTVLLNPTEAMTGLPLLQGELCKFQGIECEYVVGELGEEGQGYTIKV